MLPVDAQARKDIPIFSGFVKYFPDAIAAVAQLSFIANEQHNPGEPLHWAKEKSSDERDAQMRHIVDPVTTGGEDRDSEGVLHDVKNAWRAMANLQRLADAGKNIFAEVGKFDHCPDSTTFMQSEITSEPVEQHAQYFVQFCNDFDTSGCVTSVTRKGPFRDIFSAEQYAELNPHKIAGIKTIHALNRP